MESLQATADAQSPGVPRFDRWLGAFVVMLALAAHLVPWWRHGHDDVLSWSYAFNVIEWIVPAGASVLLWRRGAREQAWAWRLLAVGVGAWALGQVYWWLAENVFGWPTVPSPADAGFLLFPVAAIIGLLLLTPVTVESAASRLVVIFEALLFATALSFLLWLLFLEARIEALDLGAWEQVLLTTYPLSGVAVAGTGAMLRYTNRSPAILAISVGAACIALADLILATDPDAVRALTLVASHVLWTVGFAVIAVGAVLPHRSTVLTRRPPALTRAFLVFGPLAVAFALGIALISGTGRPSALTLAFGILAGVLLVVHQVAVWRESNLLSRRLDANVADLEQAGRHLRGLLDSLAEAVVVVDRAGTIVDVNRRLEVLYGADRRDLVGQPVAQLVPPSSRPAVMQQWDALVGGATDLERPRFELLRPSGWRSVIEVDARPLAEQGEQIVLSLRDVSDRAAAEVALRSAEQRFRLAFEAAPTGTALIDATSARLVDANENLAKMLRIDRDRLIGARIAELTHPDDVAETERTLKRVRSGDADGYHLRKRYVRSDGSVMWGNTSVARLETSEESTLLIGHVIDITEEVVAAERLAWSATHDEVTGLANRTHFLDVLRRELLHRERPAVSVLFLDLDRFKIVNDSLGHSAGDDLLRMMAGRLRDSVRPGDLVARFGGDEFTVMLRNADHATAIAVARRIMRGLSSPVELAEAEVDITASVGLAVAEPGRTVSAEDLVRDADAAMYRAKEQGRDRVVAFTPEARVKTVQALLGRNELRVAIERDEIIPYYQPIVELASGRLVGYESVARWRHPERGLLLPDAFLATAEERGLIGGLGAQVLRASLGQLARWIDAGIHASRVSVAVNVSARQLIDARFVDLVADALAESGLDADLLWLELTETALMTDVRSASSSLRELRDLGLHLAVDDFGTGYSSLTYLKRFPVEAIKIDRAFVAGLGIDADDSAIVEAVVRLGSSLGLLVVAEGVESPLQLARLRDLGCDRAQGYLFGRPRPAELVDAAANAT